VIKFRNGIFGFALSLCAVSAAVGLSASEVFGKSASGGHAPGVVHSPGAPATVTQSRYHTPLWYRCMKYPLDPACRAPNPTQPTCKGPHRGPNGLMIQCD
jgi:hypothetical protein